MGPPTRFWRLHAALIGQTQKVRHIACPCSSDIPESQRQKVFNKKYRNPANPRDLISRDSSKRAIVGLTAIFSYFEISNIAKIENPKIPEAGTSPSMETSVMSLSTYSELPLQLSESVISLLIRVQNQTLFFTFTDTSHVIHLDADHSSSIFKTSSFVYHLHTAHDFLSLNTWLSKLIFGNA